MIIFVFVLEGKVPEAAADARRDMPSLFVIWTTVLIAHEMSFFGSGSRAKEGGIPIVSYT